MPQRYVTGRELAAFKLGEGQASPAIVAIPARNEVGRIECCLSALAVQRTHSGMPIARGEFEVLLLANNCTDATADVARGLAPQLPFSLTVIEKNLPAENATAGGARRAAMNEAAHRLAVRRAAGIILTTDADSAVIPTWFAANMRHLAEGADCVAGYIDAEPTEMVALGSAFLRR
ncbi:MAG: glycosyltransferase [Bradyrhizobium sp.]|uniref:glycosyltransferase n=1 Tax=Bradyrhizobium sp. TaxID=376 RepID=UPI0029BE1359|nr:glycosyltransferase [Bradyrhizobium sp.]MDX3969131.1 glycosyltransferase [Bradyrhizobium sp.]